MKVAAKIHEVRGRDLLDTLSLDEIKIIRAYRCMDPRDQALARLEFPMQAERYAQARGIPELRVISGGAD